MTNSKQRQLNDRARVLTLRYKALMGMEQTPVVKEIIKEYIAEVDRLYELTSNKREYLFNFINGGWNSVYAVTVEEAITFAKSFYKDGNSTPDEKTFRVSTSEDYNSLMSNFN
jgi:hypothetical protein